MKADRRLFQSVFPQVEHEMLCRVCEASGLLPVRFEVAGWFDDAPSRRSRAYENVCPGADGLALSHFRAWTPPIDDLTLAKDLMRARLLLREGVAYEPSKRASALEAAMRRLDGTAQSAALQQAALDRQSAEFAREQLAALYERVADLTEAAKSARKGKAGVESRAEVLQAEVIRAQSLAEDFAKRLAEAEAGLAANASAPEEAKLVLREVEKRGTFAVPRVSPLESLSARPRTSVRLFPSPGRSSARVSSPNRTRPPTGGGSPPRNGGGGARPPPAEGPTPLTPAPEAPGSLPAAGAPFVPIEPPGFRKVGEAWSRNFLDCAGAAWFWAVLWHDVIDASESTKTRRVGGAPRDVPHSNSSKGVLLTEKQDIPDGRFPGKASRVLRLGGGEVLASESRSGLISSEWLADWVSEPFGYPDVAGVEPAPTPAQFSEVLSKPESCALVVVIAHSPSRRDVYTGNDAGALCSIARPELLWGRGTSPLSCQWMDGLIVIHGFSGALAEYACGVGLPRGVLAELRGGKRLSSIALSALRQPGTGHWPLFVDVASAMTVQLALKLVRSEEPSDRGRSWLTSLALQSWRDWVRGATPVTSRLKAVSTSALRILAYDGPPLDWDAGACSLPYGDDADELRALSAKTRMSLFDLPRVPAGSGPALDGLQAVGEREMNTFYRPGPVGRASESPPTELFAKFAASIARRRILSLGDVVPPGAPVRAQLVVPKSSATLLFSRSSGGMQEHLRQMGYARAALAGTPLSRPEDVSRRLCEGDFKGVASALSETKRLSRFVRLACIEDMESIIAGGNFAGFMAIAPEREGQKPRCFNALPVSARYGALVVQALLREFNKATPRARQTWLGVQSHEIATLFERASPEGALVGSWTDSTASTNYLDFATNRAILNAMVGETPESWWGSDPEVAAELKRLVALSIEIYASPCALAMVTAPVGAPRFCRELTYEIVDRCDEDDLDVLMNVERVASAGAPPAEGFHPGMVREHFEHDGVEMPIASNVNALNRAWEKNGIILVESPTGTGKTLGIALALLRAGHDVVVSQPRRLAAQRVAQRLAALAPPGHVSVRTVQDRCARPSRLHVATEHYVCEMIASSPQKTCFLLDEAHEMSDTMLAMLAYVAKKARSRVCVMTAASASPGLATFLGAEHVSLADPVPRAIVRRETSASRYAAEAIDELLARRGDIPAGVQCLHFAPTIPSGSKVADAYRNEAARRGLEVCVVQIHGRIGHDRQDELLRQASAGLAVIVSTSIAETSLTFPNLVVVVDEGFAIEGVRVVEANADALVRGRIPPYRRLQREGRLARVTDARGERRGLYLSFPAGKEPLLEGRASDASGLVARLRKLGLGMEDVHVSINTSLARDAVDVESYQRTVADGRVARIGAPFASEQLLQAFTPGAQAPRRKWTVLTTAAAYAEGFPCLYVEDPLEQGTPAALAVDRLLKTLSSSRDPAMALSKALFCESKNAMHTSARYRLLDWAERLEWIDSSWRASQASRDTQEALIRLAIEEEAITGPPCASELCAFLRGFATCLAEAVPSATSRLGVDLLDLWSNTRIKSKVDYRVGSLLAVAGRQISPTGISYAYAVDVSSVEANLPAEGARPRLRLAYARRSYPTPLACLPRRKTKSVVQLVDCAGIRKHTPVEPGEYLQTLRRLERERAGGTPPEAGRGALSLHGSAQSNPISFEILAIRTHACEAVPILRHAHSLVRSLPVGERPSNLRSAVFEDVTDEELADLQVKGYGDDACVLGSPQASLAYRCARAVAGFPESEAKSVFSPVRSPSGRLYEGCYATFTANFARISALAGRASVALNVPYLKPRTFVRLFGAPLSRYIPDATGRAGEWTGLQEVTRLSGYVGMPQLERLFRALHAPALSFLPDDAKAREAYEKACAPSTATPTWVLSRAFLDSPYLRDLAGEISEENAEDGEEDEFSTEEASAIMADLQSWLTLTVPAPRRAPDRMSVLSVDPTRPLADRPAVIKGLANALRAAFLPAWEDSGE